MKIGLIDVDSNHYPNLALRRMIMAKEQKQPTKTCADCIHESACRAWVDGRYIADSSASRCPNFETVQESAAYLCGVLDERKRKQSNADRIRAMSDKELKEFLCSILRCEFCKFQGWGGCELLHWLQKPAEPAKEE